MRLLLCHSLSHNSMFTSAELEPRVSSPSTTFSLEAAIKELSAKAQEAVVRIQEGDTRVPAQKGELLESKL